MAVSGVNHMEFKLYPVSQHQDCTMEYNVVFDTPMTVREFVEYVVNKDNSVFGFVCVYGCNILRRYQTGLVEFTNGVIESSVYDDISVPEQLITSAKLYTDISGSKRYEVLYALD